MAIDEIPLRWSRLNLGFFTYSCSFLIISASIDSLSYSYKSFKKVEPFIILMATGQKSSSFFWVSVFIFDSGYFFISTHTAERTIFWSSGGLSIFLARVTSFAVIHSRALAAALRIGIASANSFSQSSLIALASPAAFDATASSAATTTLIFSASTASASTIFSFASVYIDASISLGWRSSSSCLILETFASVEIRQLYPFSYLFLRPITSSRFSFRMVLKVVISSRYEVGVT